MRGITRSVRSYHSTEGNNRAAISITNKDTDAGPITQISNSDTDGI
jgi:hypothetical protein